MAEVKLEGLSPFQRMICDVLWTMETPQQVQQFRDSLPNAQQQAICDAMIYMLLAAVIDSTTNTEADCAEARTILSSY